MADTAAIRDYLTTQGLRLPLDDVAISMLAAQTVLAVGQGEVDAGILWYADEGVVLAQCLPEHPQRAQYLRQLLLALDATLSRSPAAAAAVYGLNVGDALSSVQTPPLLRLVSLGMPVPAACAVGDDMSRQFLPCRTAQTAWLNVIDNVADWQADGSLVGTQCGLSQLAVPICDTDGGVLGVVFAAAEYIGAFDDAAVTQWVGLALALGPFLHDWLGRCETHTKDTD